MSPPPFFFGGASFTLLLLGGAAFFLPPLGWCCFQSIFSCGAASSPLSFRWRCLLFCCISGASLLSPHYLLGADSFPFFVERVRPPENAIIGACHPGFWSLGGGEMKDRLEGRGSVEGVSGEWGFWRREEREGKGGLFDQKGFFLEFKYWSSGRDLVFCFF